MKLPRLISIALLLGLIPPTGYMKEAPIPAPGPDEVVFRPTNKIYPREPQIVLGNRAAPEFDVVPLTVKTLADMAQIYADFSRKEVRVPRDLASRSKGIARTETIQARVLITLWNAELPDLGIDIVPLGGDVVAFRTGKSIEERMTAQRPAAATPEQIAVASAAMSPDRFWQLIEAAGRGRGGGSEIDSFRMAEALQSALSTLRPEEILGFQIRMNQHMAESCRWDLWAVAYIVNGGASDDGFVYFCGWLISQGRAYYEAALKDPVRAADRAGRHQQNENEQILYSAMQAYQAKTGATMPDVPYSGPTSPTGKPWKEEDLPQLYPELTKRF